MNIYYNATPIEGYGQGLIECDRDSEPTRWTNVLPHATVPNDYFLIDGLYYNVHPYRADLKGCPVRWIQNHEPDGTPNMPHIDGYRGADYGEDEEYEEYRVTKVLENKTISAKVTISIRVLASSHPHASSIADDLIWANLIDTYEKWPVMRSIVQDIRQIKSGEMDELL